MTFVCFERSDKKNHTTFTLKVSRFQNENVNQTFPICTSLDENFKLSIKIWVSNFVQKIVFEESEFFDRCTIYITLKLKANSITHNLKCFLNKLFGLLQSDIVLSQVFS